MKIKNTIHQNPLYAGDLVAKYKAQGLITVLPPMTPNQIQAEQMKHRKGVTKKKARVL